jgi:two-component system chemotaxis response regulator CheY
MIPTMARVLVADDAGFIRRWCHRALTDEGHVVVEATTGVEAVQMYQRRRPDAVFLDLYMPAMNGLAALQEIKKLDPDARVAMLTGEGEINMVVQARALGARDYVVKPCPTTRLIASLKQILA